MATILKCGNYQFKINWKVTVIIANIRPIQILGTPIRSQGTFSVFVKFPTGTRYQEFNSILILHNRSHANVWDLCLECEPVVKIQWVWNQCRFCPSLERFKSYILRIISLYLVASQSTVPRWPTNHTHFL